MLFHVSIPLFLFVNATHISLCISYLNLIHITSLFLHFFNISASCLYLPFIFGVSLPKKGRLSINPEIRENGKEDRYERLRPQARFGAQPPRSGGSWRGDNPGRVSQGELPHSGKRGWPGPFVSNQPILRTFQSSENRKQLVEKTLSTS
ncbi:hypothetical protein [Oscillibacter valericigenes]|uniref:hypothetical protein n=1 Tax=Oscillibacter valericigenes TaxID=351091 RepID=UPI0019574819|nr:hypothetical protein [Oscillibacter valericigenes]MBM6910171.1 hypothetical protein [Oscillibacter valericigenes]